MINSITTYYISLLKAYQGGYPEAADALIAQLQVAETLSALQEQLTATRARFSIPAIDEATRTQLQAQHSPGRSSFFSCKEPIEPLQKILFAIDTDIDMRNTSYANARTAIRNIRSPNFEIEKFIQFLTEFLDDPRCLMHNDILCVLRHLQDQDTLQKIIDHMASQPEAPIQQRDRGSFNALKPASLQHQTCIALLNNVAATYNEPEGDPAIKEAANLLLQNTLRLYKDLKTEAPKVAREVETRAASVATSSRSALYTCVLL